MIQNKLSSVFIIFSAITLLFLFALSCNTAKGPKLIEYNFEDGMQQWIAYPGLTVATETVKKHGGQQCLMVHGTSGNGIWAYAESNKFDLNSEKHYKLEGWILVDSLRSDSTDPQVILKAGLYRDGKWFKNIYSPAYDLDHLGTWQMLAVDFVVPSESNLTCSITIDKSTNKKSITTVLYVDDVKLEQLE